MHTIKLTSQSLFEKIYHLAKTQDTDGLDKLIAAGYPFDFNFGGESPIGKLAIEGDHQAVYLLMNRYGANIDNALYSYAIANDHQHVKKLIDLGGDILAAVMGYAVTGASTCVDDLLKKATGNRCALIGYILGGHENIIASKYPPDFIFGDSTGLTIDVESLVGLMGNLKQSLLAVRNDDFKSYSSFYIRQFHLEPEDAVKSFRAQFGYLPYAVILTPINLHDFPSIIKEELVLNLAMGSYPQALKNPRLSNTLLLDAIESFCANLCNLNAVGTLIDNAKPNDVSYFLWNATSPLPNGLTRTRWLRELSFINSDIYRKEIAVHLVQHCELPDLYAEATRLNKIMRTHKVGYDEATALTIKGVRGYLLQGDKLKLNKHYQRLPYEIFLKIGAELTGLAEQQVDKLTTAVCTRLHAKMKQFYDKKLQVSYSSHSKSQFFSKDEHKKKLEENTLNYYKRLNRG